MARLGLANVNVNTNLPLWSVFTLLHGDDIGVPEQ